tara:strand:- start:3007 stop:4101 length:1095 start_codon:yes stop_codon:yes gene_type:complete
MDLFSRKSSRNLLSCGELDKNNDRITQQEIVDAIDSDYMFYELDNGDEGKYLLDGGGYNGNHNRSIDNINGYHSSSSTRQRYNDYHDGNTTGEDTGSDSVGELLSIVSNSIQSSSKGILKHPSNENHNNNYLDNPNNNNATSVSNSSSNSNSNNTNGNLKASNSWTSNYEDQYQVIEVHENLESRVLVRSFTNLGLAVSEHYSNVQVAVQGYRVCKDCLGRKFAQFRLSLCLNYDSAPLIAWRRHSDFDLLAHEMREAFRNDLHDDGHDDNISNTSIKSRSDFELTLQSWQDILESKPWDRQLDDEYLKSKQNYIEEFLRNLLNDSDTADVLVEFMTDDVLESKKRINCPNLFSWIENFFKMCV